MDVIEVILSLLDVGAASVYLIWAVFAAFNILWAIFPLYWLKGVAEMLGIGFSWRVSMVSSGYYSLLAQRLSIKENIVKVIRWQKSYGWYSLYQQRLSSHWLLLFLMRNEKTMNWHRKFWRIWNGRNKCIIRIETTIFQLLKTESNNELLKFFPTVRDIWLFNKGKKSQTFLWEYKKCGCP